MSWKTLKDSFNTSSRNVSILPSNPIKKRRQRKLRQNENRYVNIINFSDDEEPSTSKTSKRIKLNTKKHKIAVDVHSSDSGDEVIYDPDYDDYCNGCCTLSSKKYPLDMFSPSKQKQPLSINSTANIISPSSTKNNPWDSITSIRQEHNEINFLERSICELDSTDSDASTEPHKNRQIFEESSQSQKCLTNNKIHISQSDSNSTSESHLQQAENPDLDFLVAEIQRELNSEKRIRCKKGGHVERLRKVLHKSESDFAFWQYEREAGLVPPGMIGEIIDITKSFGQDLIKVKLDNSKQTVVNVLIGKKFGAHIKVGGKIEIDLSSNVHLVGNSVVYLGCNKLLRK